jgi:hypothetical protein
MLPPVSSRQPTKISDPAVLHAARRLDEYTRMLARRLRDYGSAENRVDRTLALIEAEVAAQLIQSGAHEFNLRLLPLAVQHDLEAEVKKRTRGLAEARADHERRFGPIPVA